MGGYPDLPRDYDYASIDRSHLDARVWVPHIPYSDIAQSEGMATTSIRRAKEHVFRMCAESMDDPVWAKASPDMWVLYERIDL